MVDFKKLKNNRLDNLKKLQEETQKLNETGYETDPDDWYPGVDKVGNGYALIRFLPRINDEDLEYSRWWSHNFQDPNTKKWYIENCRFTLDKSSDPVMEFNKKLWDSVEDSPSAKFHPNRIQATRQSRKINYRANIFVVEDGVNPENNGKTKKFKFGKWAFDKIEGLMFPKFAGKKAINPFDLWDGANFRIEIISETKDGKKQRNYSTSAFEKPEPLASDDEMEKIFESIQGWSVKSYLSPSNFKEYDVLKKRLDEVVGYDTSLWTSKGLKKEEVNLPKNTKKVEEKEDVSVESDDFFKSIRENSEEDTIPF
jgi:hypothetical protein